MYAWGPTKETTTAIGNKEIAGTYIPQYTFTYSGTEYTKAATEYTINNVTLVEIYAKIPVVIPAPAVTPTTSSTVKYPSCYPYFI
jgi:hypothetical protein